MKLTVCIGSSCHLKGSRQIVEEFQKRIADQHLENKIDLAGTFCLGECQSGVSVKIDDALYHLAPQDAGAVFEKEVLPKLK